MFRSTRHTPHRLLGRQLQLESLEQRTLLSAISLASLAPRTTIPVAVARPVLVTAPVSAATITTPATVTDRDDILVADIDGDGHDDVIGRSAGEWLISRSAGGGSQCQLAGIKTVGVAALPSQCVDSLIAPPRDRTPIVVPAGGNLQAAIDAAVPGDIIELEAGATYRGRFTIGPKVGEGWIHFRSSRHAELPAPGTRVDPALHAQLMPKIVASGANAAGRAIDILLGAHHLRFEGIEITSDHSQTSSIATNLVVLNSAGATSAADLPHHIIFDRTYIHGNSTGSVLNGIRADGRHVAIVDSHLSNFHAIGAESHAVYAADGAGPIKIVNNYLEAAGVNVLLGGDDPVVPGLVNQDIEIRGNLITKQEAWRTGPAVHKFLLDLKNARRVLITENVLENSWADGRFSDGSAILVKSTNQAGACPWCVAEDVTISHNILRNVAKGVKVAGRVADNSGRTQRVVIENNLLHDLDRNVPGGGAATAFELLEDYDDVYFVHNTAISTGQTPIVLGSNLSPTRLGQRLVVQDNLITHNEYGVKGTGTPIGAASLDAWVVEYLFTHNVLYGPNANANSYPADNDFPAIVNFVAPTQANFRLADGSPFVGTARDGTNVGVDFDSVDAVGCVNQGACFDANRLTDTVQGKWSAVAGWVDVRVGDVDGDGMDDILGRTQGEWWVSRSTGTGFINQHWGDWSTKADWTDVQTADVDGDGKDDIVGRTNGAWWVAKSSGSSFQNQRWGAWSKGVTWADVSVADVDGDGRDDIVGRANGEWWVARSTGTSFVNQLWGTWSNTSSWVDVHVDDMNGDGMDDIVGRVDGAWWVAQSTGSRFASKYWGRWSTGVVWHDVQVADVNGDGNSDVLGRTGNDWWVAISNGDSFGTRFWGRWSGSWSHVTTADVNGDGKTDLVGLAGDQWSVALSGGSSFLF